MGDNAAMPAAAAAHESLGSFMLDGPVVKPDPARVPLRGDLAHIMLAGTYFVPHYAVPQTRVVGPSGAQVLAGGNSDAEIRAELAAGDTFDVLDIAGSWAWGWCGTGGAVGYVGLDRLGTAQA